MAKIVGNVTAINNPVPDWNQKDPTKADFIKNKPTIQELYDELDAMGMGSEDARKASQEAKESAETAVESATIAREKANYAGDAAIAAEVAAEKAETKVESLFERNKKLPVSIWVGTQEEYDAIAEKEANRLYIINDETIADFVVEQGVSKSWYYRKWNSGRYECWGSFVGNPVKVNISFGSMFKNDNSFSGIAALSRTNYPTVFKEAPVLTITLNKAQTQTGDTSLIQGIFLSPRTENMPGVTPMYDVCCVKDYGDDLVEVTADIYAIGLWK